MSINSALLAGVSGLVANSSALAAISDNIANVNTTAYKRNAVNFANVVTAQAVKGQYSAGGVPAITRATPEFVRRHTGQAIGGVAPVGHPEPIGTLVDIELARHEQVWAAAGHPHTVFPTTYDELLRLTGGTPAEVGSGPVAAPQTPAEETASR